MGVKGRSLFACGVLYDMLLYGIIFVLVNLLLIFLKVAHMLFTVTWCQG